MRQEFLGILFHSRSDKYVTRGTRYLFIFLYFFVFLCKIKMILRKLNLCVQENRCYLLRWFIEKNYNTRLCVLFVKFFNVQY